MEGMQLIQDAVFNRYMTTKTQWVHDYGRNVNAYLRVGETIYAGKIYRTLTIASISLTDPENVRQGLATRFIQSMLDLASNKETGIELVYIENLLAPEMVELVKSKTFKFKGEDIKFAFCDSTKSTIHVPEEVDGYPVDLCAALVIGEGLEVEARQALRGLV